MSKILYEVKEKYLELNALAKLIENFKYDDIHNIVKFMYNKVNGNIERIHNTHGCVEILGNVKDYTLCNLIYRSSLQSNLNLLVEDLTMGYYAYLCGGKNRRAETYAPKLIELINELE